jgi:hypothetical protein
LARTDFQCRRNKVKQGEIRVSDYNGFLMYMEFSAFLSWVWCLASLLNWSIWMFSHDKKLGGRWSETTDFVQNSWLGGGYDCFFFFRFSLNTKFWWKWFQNGPILGIGIHVRCGEDVEIKMGVGYDGYDGYDAKSRPCRTKRAPLGPLGPLGPSVFTSLVSLLTVSEVQLANLWSFFEVSGEPMLFEQ